VRDINSDAISISYVFGPAMLFTTNKTTNKNVNKTSLVFFPNYYKLIGNYSIIIILTDNSTCGNSVSYYKMYVNVFNVSMLNTTH
jgi:hypothetical protein